MSLGQTISNAATNAIVDHGQLALLVKRDDTFDKVQGRWKAGKVTKTVVHFVPEEFSELTRAIGQVAGDVKIHVPASELNFVPFVGSGNRRHLEVYFGDWATTSEVKETTATESGTVQHVGKSARYQNTQILWELTVKTSG